MTSDWKEAAGKYADAKLDHWIENAKRLVVGDGANVKVGVACRIVSYKSFLSGAEHGYAEGIEEKNDVLEKLIDSANQLKQQVEVYRDAIKDKDLAYSLMKEACEDFKQQLADMKWEYENACKFATDFEQQRDKLKQRLEDAEQKRDELLDLIRRCLRIAREYKNFHVLGFEPFWEAIGGVEGLNKHAGEGKKS